MAECVPFLKVRDIAQTIAWYENIGFTCTATNQIWEPDCEINWARLEWKGAGFMLGPDERENIFAGKDTSLWFNAENIDAIMELLTNKGIPMDIEEETFYGRKVITCKDINSFDVSFSCALVKK